MAKIFALTVAFCGERPSDHAGRSGGAPASTSGARRTNCCGSSSSKRFA